MSNARFSIIQSRAVKDKKVSDAQLRTLNALGMYADQFGWCFPSQTRLAEDLGKSRESVNRDISALAKLGYVEKHRNRRQGGTWSSNSYRLVFDKPYDEDDHVIQPSQGVDDHVTLDVTDHVTLDDTHLVTPDVTLTTHINDPEERPIKQLTEKEYIQAGKQVQAMVESSKKARYDNRDQIPEPYLDLCDTYVEMTGQKPSKRVLMDWIATFSDWVSEGLTPKDVRAAYLHANRPDGGFLVSRPGSLTNTAAALKHRSPPTARSKTAVPGVGTGLTPEELASARARKNL